MKNRRFILLLILCFVCTLGFVGCKSQYRDGIKSVAKLENIDYSCDENWATKPNELKFDYDVFYVYPTVILSGKNNEMDYALKSDYSAAVANVKGATAMMSKYANIYAPLYRQATLEAFIPFNDFADVASKSERGKRDVEDAFLYYMENLNKGRPFIIFAHSQGSALAYELLKKYFKSNKMRQNFVAAYLSGMLLMKEDLAKYPYLKFAKNDSDLGVIMVWNVQSPDAGENFFIQNGGLGINPATWQVNDIASKERYVLSETGRKYFEPSAKLDLQNGATIVKLQNHGKYEMEVFGKGVYHIGNLSLFMNSISENMQKRFESF